MTTTVVSRWQFAVVCTGVLAVAGLVFTAPALVIGGVIPLSYVVYGYTSRPPAPTLSVTRTIETETPTPGTRVAVTLTVTNDGESAVSDLRIVDGVPGPLPVVDGSPRRAVALRPGDSTTLTYQLRARRGVYRFTPARWRVRSVQGGHVVTGTATPDAETTLRCLDTVDAFPLPRQTRQYVGMTTADEGGEGVEFFGSREYRPTDPARRIDWNRVASTGELTTLVHREERSRATVFLLDASAAAAVGGGEGTYTGVELGAYAIERGAHALRTDDDSVGLGILGTTVGDRPAFVEPGGGEATLERIRYALAGVSPFVEDALATEDRESPDADAEVGDENDPDPEAPAWVRTDRNGGAPTIDVDDVLAQTTSDTQFVVVSPLHHDGALSIVETLREHQRVVSVVAPDVTAAETLGGRVARLDRVRRIRTAERAGIPVVDWAAEEPLQEAVIRSTARLERATEATQSTPGGPAGDDEGDVEVRPDG